MGNSFSPPTLSETLFSALERLGDILQFKTEKTQALSPLQSRILIALAQRPGGINFSQLVQSLNISRANSTISTSLNSLVKQGLVDKQRNPADRRQYCFRLSPSGHQASQQILHFQQGVQRSLLALSQTQQTQLLKSLLAFLHQLQLNELVSIEGMCFLCAFFELRSEQGPYCQLLKKPLIETSFPSNWYQLSKADSKAERPC